MYTLLMLRKREGTFFSELPMELLLDLSEYGQNPNSDIAKALHHAAYARQEDALYFWLCWRLIQGYFCKRAM